MLKHKRRQPLLQQPKQPSQLGTKVYGVVRDREKEVRVLSAFISGKMPRLFKPHKEAGQYLVELLRKKRYQFLMEEYPVLAEERVIAWLKKQEKRREIKDAVFNAGTYQDYLLSTYWKKKRKQVLKHYGSCCVACGSTRYLQVHHGTYKRLGKEKIKDLFCVCDNCHKAIHAEHERRKRIKDKPELLWSVTRQYVKKRNKLWRKPGRVI